MGETKDNAPLEETYKLTPYTAMAMINVLIASVTAVLSMVVYAKPFYYYLQAKYGEMTEMSLQFTEALALPDKDVSRINMFFLIAAILVLAATVIALISVIATTNPQKKPFFIPSIIECILAGAGVGIFVYGISFIKSLLVDSMYVQNAVISYRFGIFGAAVICLIVNALSALINIFTVASGYNRWKKTGKSY